MTLIDTYEKKTMTTITEQYLTIFTLKKKLYILCGLQKMQYTI